MVSQDVVLGPHQPLLLPGALGHMVGAPGSSSASPPQPPLCLQSEGGQCVTNYWETIMRAIPLPQDQEESVPPTPSRARAPFWSGTGESQPKTAGGVT